MNLLFLVCQVRRKVAICRYTRQTQENETPKFVHGGFGKVMTAKYDRTQQWHAVKEIVKVELVKHRTGLAMIMGELRALKKVDHPLIISLHFAFQDREKCYFVMDLKTGGDLRYYLRKKIMFEENDVAFYVSCISSALHHIHSQNIIHRDVKPENIILDERGYPHLADFGVAHVQSSSSASQPLTCSLASGTKQYLAPEVFTKGHVHGLESGRGGLRAAVRPPSLRQALPRGHDLVPGEGPGPAEPQGREGAGPERRQPPGRLAELQRGVAAALGVPVAVQHPVAVHLHAVAAVAQPQ
mmetsp:Transcript_30899/g.44386  ORF Transcript_30899/g.44386 Transcript_30899/m.44386 type:complete len:298 (-) Transcript_30899:1041-1934(-)